MSTPETATGAFAIVPRTGRARAAWQSLRIVPLLEPRQTVSRAMRATVYLSALFLAGVLSVALLVWAGVPAGDLWRELSSVAFNSPRALASVLAQTAPLVVAGLATSIAFRVGFWNIGIEGQMILGAVLATAVAVYDIGPEPLRLPLMALAACLGGMAWIAGPGWLKARLSMSEVITTLLLNYVAFNLLLHLLYGPWQDPASRFPHSEQFAAAERLPRLGWQNLTWSVPLAAGLALALWWVMSKSRLGYLLDLLRHNRHMAHALGVPVAGISIAAVLGSGAVGGLAGFTIVAGIESRLTQDFFVGYLFSGILIAFLARNNPVGVVVAAFFLATLMMLGQSLQVFFGIPFALIRLIQAIFIISVAGSEFFLGYRMHWRRAA
ncbi:MAG: ABC transporter permease [Pararhodobacter sp.]|nr:ABC transporter permease [Pararhodobacter sp.]